MNYPVALKGNPPDQQILTRCFYPSSGADLR
jgi:hypothetical protein